MDKDKKKIIQEKINETVEKFQGITGLPTSFRLETTEGAFVFDKETGEFIKENGSWMADSPKRWMADNPSVEPPGTERVVIGTTTSPDGVEAYSQRFESGKLVVENRDIFLDKKMIEDGSSSEKIEEITDEDIKEEKDKNFPEQQNKLLGIEDEEIKKFYSTSTSTQKVIIFGIVGVFLVAVWLIIKYHKKTKSR